MLVAGTIASDPIGVARDRGAIGRVIGDAEQALDPQGDGPGDQQRELLELVVTQRPEEQSCRPTPSTNIAGVRIRSPTKGSMREVAVQRVAQGTHPG